MTPKELLETLTIIESGLSEGPWSLECVREAIRHVERNVDHEQYCCCESDEPKMFGRSDGAALAALRNTLPEIRLCLARLAE